MSADFFVNGKFLFHMKKKIEKAAEEKSAGTAPRGRFQAKVGVPAENAGSSSFSIAIPADAKSAGTRSSLR